MIDFKRLIILIFLLASFDSMTEARVGKSIVCQDSVVATGDDSAHRSNDLHRGSWLGLRVGMQTNGVDIDQRWTASVLYEARSGPAALYGEYQIWRHLEYEHPAGVNSFSTVMNLNFGFHLLGSIGKFKVGLRAGVNTPLYLSIISAHYGLSFEYSVSSDYHVFLSQKNFPEIEHFLFLGILKSL
jgi:hypothetical protein